MGPSMRCPACGSENASGVKFCGECGSSLKVKCSSCGFENAPSMKFCGECGAPENGAPPALATGSAGSGVEREGRGY
jgi:hypothetical protein